MSLIRVICTGYCVGEVIPVNNNTPLTEQKAVLDYLDLHKDTLKIGYSFELYRILKRRIFGTKKLDQKVEIIGAVYNACVYDAARIVLERGSEIKIDPKKTISGERIFRLPKELSEEKDLEEKIKWFRCHLPKISPEVHEENRIFVCSGYRN